MPIITPIKKTATNNLLDGAVQGDKTGAVTQKNSQLNNHAPAQAVSEFRQYIKPQSTINSVNTAKTGTSSNVLNGTMQGVIAGATQGQPQNQVSNGSSSSGGNSNYNGGSSYYSGVANVNTNLQSLYEQQQNALSEQLKAQQAWYESQLRAQQQAKQQAAQNAYNSNMSALQQAYARKQAGLDSNLASTKDLLASSYGSSRDTLNANAEKALQEAYINRMMNEKSLRQQLNAQGLNGGASESAIASMLNNYGNSRNNINTATIDSLRSLEEAYNTNLANAQQKYNDAVGSAEDINLAYRMQLENDLANTIVGSYSDLYSGLANMDSNYLNAMTNLITNQAAASADLQQALSSTMLKNSLKASSPTVTGASEGDSSSMVNKLKQMYQNGATFEELAGLSDFAGYDPADIAQYFAEAGIV